jgi:hypothetical protein
MPNLFCSKSDLPEFENFAIKCGCEGFEIRNNFSYRNFSIFVTGLE